MSGATKAEAAATAGTSKEAGPTGMGAGAIGRRKLPLTGGGSNVTVRAVAPVVVGSNKKEYFHQTTFADREKAATMGTSENFQKMTLRLSMRPCRVTGRKRILWTHGV